MGAIIDHWSDEALGHVLNGENCIFLSEIYVGLLVIDKDLNLVEPSDGNYARVKVLHTDWTIDGDMRNSNDIEFPTATKSWGVATHFVLFDKSGKNLVLGSLTQPKIILPGEIVKFAAGDLRITI